jgi:hypothetical protein
MFVRMDQVDKSILLSEQDRNTPNRLDNDYLSICCYNLRLRGRLLYADEVQHKAQLDSKNFWTYF